MKIKDLVGLKTAMLNEPLAALVKAMQDPSLSNVEAVITTAEAAAAQILRTTPTSGDVRILRIVDDIRTAAIHAERCIKSENGIAARYHLKSALQ